MQDSDSWVKYSWEASTHCESVKLWVAMSIYEYSWVLLRVSQISSQWQWHPYLVWMNPTPVGLCTHTCSKNTDHGTTVLIVSKNASNKSEIVVVDLSMARKKQIIMKRPILFHSLATLQQENNWVLNRKGTREMKSADLQNTITAPLKLIILLIHKTRLHIVLIAQEWRTL